MPQTTNRGYFPSDKKDFGPQALPVLQAAQRDISYLLSRGYDLEHSVTFVGNRFQFSARQRTALTRATTAPGIARSRKERRSTGPLPGQTVFLDTFNLIITLEAALSPQTTLLHCMDGTVRDLCGLHGTYRLIGATGQALAWVGEALAQRQVGKAVFYLDAPVSNSGRLKAAVLHEMKRWGLPAEAILVPNADALLWGKENVATSDAIILDRCPSWVNLAKEIILRQLPGRPFVDLTASHDPPLWHGAPPQE